MIKRLKYPLILSFVLFSIFLVSLALSQPPVDRAQTSLPTASTPDPTPTLPEPTLPPQAMSRQLVLGVPFTSQAPFGQWSDPKQQDGCEEASSLMAVYWAQGKTLTKEEALNEIIKASQYQEQNYGTFHDTSTSDTLERIIKGYFHYQNAAVKTGISQQDILEALKQDNLVIVPLNGRLIGNPYYTAPGPERHMLLIRGYNSETKEFITNDPGTRQGELYRYPQERLYNAIGSYPTGNHETMPNIREKEMIIVRSSR